jgi:hypothetical protein
MVFISERSALAAHLRRKWKSVEGTEAQEKELKAEETRE